MKPPLFPMAAFSLFALARAGGAAGETVPPEAAAASRQAFLDAYPVFAHPRCVNCHPAGDRPLQGEPGRPHQPPVARGDDGFGLHAMR